jgi:hypothetical protein
VGAMGGRASAGSTVSSSLLFAFAALETALAIRLQASCAFSPLGGKQAELASIGREIQT